MSSTQLILLLNFFVKQAMNKLDLKAALQKRLQPKDTAVYLSSAQPFRFLQDARYTMSTKLKKRKILQVQIL